jgi:hypothetical protein
MKLKKQPFGIQNNKRSLLLMFWCCGVHIKRVAQNAEYSLDKLTDVILLYGEEPLHSCTVEGICNDNIQIT